MNTFVIFLCIVLVIELCMVLILNSIMLSDIHNEEDEHARAYLTAQLTETNVKMFVCIAVTLIAILGSYILGVYVHGGH